MNPTGTADQYLNIFPSDQLAAVSRGEFDLNEVAAMNSAGRWIGFPAAARLLEHAGSVNPPLGDSQSTSALSPLL